MRRKTTIAMAAAAFLMAVVPADAALMAYMYAKGSRTGAIKGSITQKGREDSIGIIAYEHEVRTPTDASTGGANGKRQHSVFKVTKELDKSTPVLYNAWAIGDTIDVAFKFWTPQIKAATGTGAEVQHYTVHLTNARIVNIKSQMQNVKNPDLVKFDQTEEISLTYSKIEWTWNDGGITAGDDWQARN